MIDKAILDTNLAICKNVESFDKSERGLLSQNILSQLRNFVEYIAGKIYANGADVDPNNYPQKGVAIEYLKSRGELQFLHKFHNLLQLSVSHYTIDEDGSERLMLKYYEYLLKIKFFLKRFYNLDVLENIEKFPLDTDKELFEYHKKISEKICNPSFDCHVNPYNDRYYIQKIKPFFVGQQIFYEITFTLANNRSSKFDRIIAFTQLDILENYAVKLAIHNDHIEIFGKTMTIMVIHDWRVSIRPCEFDNFTKIFGQSQRISSNSKEYTGLMTFLTERKITFSELIKAQDGFYQYIKSKVTENSKSIYFFHILDQCRNLILSNKSGANIIRYLLYRLNNKIIKDQYKYEECDKLSGLRLEYGCIPFDQMPYASSLINHNPSIYDLFECISHNGREHELLGRLIRNNTEIKGELFTPQKEITSCNSINSLNCLIQTYNSKLYYKHQHRRIEVLYDNIYIRGYAEDSAFIIQELKQLAAKGVYQYTNSHTCPNNFQNGII